MSTATIGARQRELVDVARREFVDRGYGGASIRAIAQHADVSLSALYYYYASKQDLLRAILDDGLATFVDVCTAELDRATDEPDARLCAVVTGLVRFRTLHQQQSRLVQTEVRNLEPAHLADYQQRQHASIDPLRTAVADGVRTGVFRTPYPDDARRAIVAMCNSIAYWYSPEGPDTVDDIAERYRYLALSLVGYTGTTQGGTRA